MQDVYRFDESGPHEEKCGPHGLVDLLIRFGKNEGETVWGETRSRALLKRACAVLRDTRLHVTSDIHNCAAREPVPRLQRLSTVEVGDPHKACLGKASKTLTRDTRAGTHKAEG